MIDNPRARALNRPYGIIQNPVINRQRIIAAKLQGPRRRVSVKSYTMQATDRATRAQRDRGDAGAVGKLSVIGVVDS